MCAQTDICERLDFLIHKFAIYSWISWPLKTCHGQNIQQTLNPGVTDQLNPCEKWEMYNNLFIHSFLFSVFWHGYTCQENELYYFWNGTGRGRHTGARIGSVGPQKEGSGFKSWPCGFFFPPRTCTWGKWWFKFPLSGVNESVNGCLFQCFSPVMSWRPIQGVALPAQRRLGPHKGIKW